LNFARFMLLAALRVYRAVLSPVLTFVFAPLGFGCRFRPTCSEYATDAVRRHGAWRGSALAVRRICRCHPWGGSGYDPVPGSCPPPSN
jgi:uncharacterized protein